MDIQSAFPQSRIRGRPVVQSFYDLPRAAGWQEDFQRATVNLIKSVDDDQCRFPGGVGAEDALPSRWVSPIFRCLAKKRSPAITDQR